jgi:hypothetical protein
MGSPLTRPGETHGPSPLSPATELPIGTVGQYVKHNGTTWIASAPGAGGGDVVGPVGATQYNLVAFADATGLLIADSGIATDGAGNLLLDDSATYFRDGANPDRRFVFECSGIDPATTRTLTVPNASGTIALLTVLQTTAVRTRTAFIENQAPAVETIRLRNVPTAATITRITHITSAGTVDFNIEKRAEATPFTTGTNVFSSDKQATTTNATETTFNSAAIAARDWLVIDVSAVSTPGTLIVKIEFTLD